jgi:hypothetical protein
MAAVMSVFRFPFPVFRGIPAEFAAICSRFKVILGVTGAIIFLFSLLTLTQAKDPRPWDEPVSCPRCQSDRVVYILYGEPILDDDLKLAIKQGKVELAGCIVTSESKRWECRKCNYGWGNVTDSPNPKASDGKRKTENGKRYSQ